MTSAWLFVLLAILPLAGQEDLLVNGGFELDADADGMPDGWDQERPANQPGAFARDTTMVAEGSASLRIEHPDPGTGWVRSSQERLALQPRTMYRAEVQVRGTAPYSVLLYEFTPDDPERKYLVHTIAQSAAGHDDWKTGSLVLTTGELARTGKLSCVTEGPGTAWFDGLRLVPVGGAPETTVAAVAAPPVIDGRLDDPAWAGAPPLSTFHRLGEVGRPPAAGSVVRAVWTPTHLYLAAELEEPEPAKLKAAATGHDGAVFGDDCFEVFLDPEAGGTGFAHFAVNSRATRYDARRLSTRYNTSWFDPGGALQVDWDPAWEAETAVGEGGWTVEIAIPFASLGEAPRPGAVWGANFTRERQVVAELSTWAPLAGKTFQAPEQFGRLSFIGAAGAESDILTRTAAQLPARDPLVPAPQEVMWGEGEVTLPAPLLLRPTVAAARTYLAESARLLGAVVLPVGEPQPETITVGLTDEANLPAEGYRLTAGADGVTVLGADAAGVRNGLMTLAQLLVPGADGWTVPAVSIRDWPDLPVRGWHVSAPLAGQEEKLLNWADGLARLKYNTIVLQVDDYLKYESHPEISRSNALTKDQLRAIVDRLKALGFDVIPQLATYGHFQWVLSKPGWSSMAEHPDSNPADRWAFWNANFRDPRYYPLLFDLYREVIEVFAPTTFHIGHDEIATQPMGVHPAVADTPPDELFVEEIGPLHAWLTERGLKVMMWGDMMLRDQAGGAPHNTYRAMGKLPPDIIIAAWHYRPTHEFTSPARFAAAGHPVVTCGWWHPLNLFAASNVAVDQHLAGFLGTSWLSVPGQVNSAELQTGLVIGAENSWSNRRPELADVEYEPLRVWQRLVGWWSSVPAETRFRPLELTAQANRSLTDTARRDDWLGTGPGYDLSPLPTGLHWWWGVPYRIGEGAQAAVVVGSTNDDPTLLPPNSGEIPVGLKATALYFAHVTEAPAARHRYSDIYARETPGVLGHYVIRYRDGAEERLKLEFRRNITDWNATLPPAWAPTIWDGQTTAGARAQVAAWRWDNPRPDAEIESVRIERGESPFRIALLAVTAAIE